MTLNSQAVNLSGSSASDLAAYPTATVPLNVGARTVAFVVSGKSANLAESPTSVSHATNGAFTKIASVAIPNTNLVLSAWSLSVTSATTGVITITHANVMENCAWHVASWTSTAGVPSVRQSGSSASAAAGSESTALPAAALSSSIVIGALGYNSGSTNTPTAGSGFAILGTRQTQTSPTVQLLSEYATGPLNPTNISWSVPVAAGRAQLAVEIADGVVTTPPPSGPTVEIDGVSGTASYWVNGSEIAITSLEFA